MRKRLLFFGIMLLLAVRVDAQTATEPIIPLKSIPAEGLLLDKGWTFHTSDDSRYSQFEYVKGDGIPVNPTLLLDQLPVVKRASIGWFRLRLRVDSSLLGRVMNLNLAMLGAAEIYFNGERIYQFGHVDPNYELEHTQAIYSQVLGIRTSDFEEQILAVRYSYHPRNLYLKMGTVPACLSMTMRTPDEGTKYFGSFVKQINFFFGISFCIEITAALLTLYFFFSFPLRREYLYFGFYFIFQFFGMIFQLDVLGVGKTTQYSGNHYFLITYVESALLLTASFFYFNGIYALFKIARTKFYWFLFFYGVLGLVAVLFLPVWAGGIPLLFFPISCFEILPVCYRAMRRGFRGARILFVSICVTFLLLLILIKAISENNALLGVIVLAIIFLAPAFGLMAFLAVDFARTSLSLQARINQVEELSQKTIAQEKEKQEILSEQKNKLEMEVEERTAQLSKSLKDLKSTQAQLIQSEKMASLGELTAGIAHEIQNPINFVNNFSEVNNELIEELNAERLKPNAERNSQLENEIINSIKENERKINHHGKRADAIVKGMLQHSRANAGQKEPTDINALAEEYLRLSYHGIRNKDISFNVEIQTDFDPSVGKVDIIRQDMARVLLNLYNNAFYALAERKKTATDGYKPFVLVSTKKNGKEVTISVSDNGIGIPDKIKDKIFQPFFTTKPTGQGTGLGLSLSYDIVKTHGGALKVETKEGEGTEFVVQLPV